MPERVETYDPDGVDYGWVMQTTFVVTIVVGAPVVALASLATPLESWGARAEFAIRVGAVVWILTALGVYAFARRVDDPTGDEPADDESTDDEHADDEFAADGPRDDEPADDERLNADGERPAETESE
ncbi:DUF5822 domain-containing protein [Halobaculum sp. MBLA0147]|uniref:DUF5822 domain-containing protein n=1 Tax=Halobaculum sp. MBLA0147 TaxID=3079934 RepID=UPI0035245FA1